MLEIEEWNETKIKIFSSCKIPSSDHVRGMYYHHVIKFYFKYIRWSAECGSRLCFVPMQEGINKVGTWISDKAANLKNLSDVMAENEDLQNQVDELTTELNTIKLEQYELDNLRELYNLDQKYPSYEKVAANVIGKTVETGLILLQSIRVVMMELKWI